jgi:hypothetical protein
MIHHGAVVRNAGSFDDAVLIRLEVGTRKGSPENRLRRVFSFDGAAFVCRLPRLPSQS